MLERKVALSLSHTHINTHTHTRTRIQHPLNSLTYSACALKQAIGRVMREEARVYGKKTKKIQTRENSSNESSTQSSVVKKDSAASFTLQRRMSTATVVSYDMYLLNLSTMLKLFGTSSQRKKNLHLCHQTLLENGELTRFEDLPLGSFTLFVSHEWLSQTHPDPIGAQLSTMCSVLRNLRDAKFPQVNMDVIHRLTYKHNFTTTSREWKSLLSNAYIWYDWWSQPQPTEEIEGT